MTNKLASADAEIGNGRPSIREANVEAFLDAAERLLVREGAAGISTRQLAREAGQNHGLVHYYFGSVDELLMQTLERFTDRVLERQRAMYATDAPFAEKWRTAIGFIEEDLAAGYPKVWAELEALAWNKPELRERLNAPSTSAGARCCATRSPRRSTSTAWTGALLGRGLGRAGHAVQQGPAYERLLGFDRGHAELLAAIDGWLTSLEERKA